MKHSFVVGLVIGIWLLIFVIWMPTPKAQLSKVDGTAVIDSGTPTLGACGTTPSLSATASNNFGTINVGSGVVTSCTLNFSNTLASVPSCVVSTSLTTTVAGIVPSATSLVV